MPGSAAKRILDAAAANRMKLRALADGTIKSRQIAVEQLQDRAKSNFGQFRFTIPRDGGGEIIEALLPEGRYEPVKDYDDS